MKWLKRFRRSAAPGNPRFASRSPIDLYVAGGGDMASASPFTAALLMEAERGHQRHDGFGSVAEVEVEDMSVGSVRYTVPWALWRGSDGHWWLRKHHGTRSRPFGTAKMRVERRADGYHVFIGGLDEKWEPKPWRPELLVTKVHH